jgi:hypothetical protein
MRQFNIAYVVVADDKISIIATIPIWNIRVSAHINSLIHGKYYSIN